MDILGSQEHYKLSNFFIKNSQLEGLAITNFKLQKLMFIGYGWTLAILEKNLIGANSNFHAWKYGPVHLETYHSFKSYGYDSIDSLSYFYDSDTANEGKIEPEYKNKDKEILDVLNKCWQEYGRLKASVLVSITHEKEVPWFNQFKSTAIQHDVVKNYYQSL